MIKIEADPDSKCELKYDPQSAIADSLNRSNNQSTFFFQIQQVVKDTKWRRNVHFAIILAESRQKENHSPYPVIHETKT